VWNLFAAFASGTPLEILQVPLTGSLRGQAVRGGLSLPGGGGRSRVGRGDEASKGKQAFKKAEINTCEEAFCLRAGALIQSNAPLTAWQLMSRKQITQAAAIAHAF